jgi:hypothetical protein
LKRQLLALKSIYFLAAAFLAAGFLALGGLGLGGLLLILGLGSLENLKTQKFQ